MERKRENKRKGRISDRRVHRPEINNELIIPFLPFFYFSYFVNNSIGMVIFLNSLSLWSFFFMILDEFFEIRNAKIQVLRHSYIYRMKDIIMQKPDFTINLLRINLTFSGRIYIYKIDITYEFQLIISILVHVFTMAPLVAWDFMMRLAAFLHFQNYENC